LTASLDDEEQRSLRAQIAAQGFQTDPLAASDTPSWGLNLACGWPLPVDPGAYQQLAAGLAALDPGLVVYPHVQTHITLLTLVSFKEHLAPSPERQRALEEVIPLVNAVVGPVARGLAPFDLELGPPALSPRAVFLPIHDPAGAVAGFRRQVLPALRALSPLFQRIQPPRAVHSTVARFRAAPGPDFPQRFDRWAGDRALGPLRVTSLLVTTETRPYMRGGGVAGAFSLGS